MNKRWEKVLNRHCGRNLVELRSRIKGAGTTVGYIVDYSQAFILIHRMDKDSFRLNGYCVLRNEDVTEYRAFSRTSHWQNRAATALGLRPKRPSGISLNSLPELLQSVAGRYPLLVVHPEEKNTEVCYIGPLLSVSSKTFKIDDLDSNCEWTGPRRIRIQDVTRIEFGGGYESALAATAPKRRKP